MSKPMDSLVEGISPASKRDVFRWMGNLLPAEGECVVVIEDQKDPERVGLVALCGPSLIWIRYRPTPEDGGEPGLRVSTPIANVASQKALFSRPENDEGERLVLSELTLEFARPLPSGDERLVVPKLSDAYEKGSEEATRRLSELMHRLEGTTGEEPDRTVSVF